MRKDPCRVAEGRKRKSNGGQERRFLDGGLGDVLRPANQNEPWGPSERKWLAWCVQAEVTPWLREVPAQCGSEQSKGLPKTARVRTVRLQP